MSKSNTWENDLLLLLFNNTNAGGIGDATGLRGSTAAGSLYLGLYTADPGEAGNQSTNETAYTNYARGGIARTGAGWAVTGNAVENAALLAFPACGVTGSTVTHVGLGTDPSGAGKLLYSGALAVSLPIANGITPEFAAGAFDLTED